MLKLLVIGMGQAGNKIASAVSQEEIPAIAVNSSQHDLDSISVSSTYLTLQPIKLDEKNGCGGERKLSRRIMKEKSKEFISENTLLIDNADLIIVVSSTGGGYGSGACPITSGMLMSMKKRVVTIGILPRVADSVLGNENSNGFITDYMRMCPNGSLLLADNNRYPNLPIKEVHDIINTDIVNLIKFINGDYTLNNARESVIDDNDKLRTVIAPGLGVFSTYKSTQTTETVDTESIISNMIIDSNFAFSTKDIIPNILTVYNISNTSINTSKETLCTKYGKAVFEKNHINDTVDDDSPSIICLCSGLNMPLERIKIGKAMADEIKSKAKVDNSDDVLSMLNTNKSESSSFSFNNPPQSSDDGTNNRSEIIDDFLNALGQDFDDDDGLI